MHSSTIELQKVAEELSKSIDNNPSSEDLEKIANIYKKSDNDKIIALNYAKSLFICYENWKSDEKNDGLIKELFKKYSQLSSEVEETVVLFCMLLQNIAASDREVIEYKEVFNQIETLYQKYQKYQNDTLTQGVIEYYEVILTNFLYTSSDKEFLLKCLNKLKELFKHRQAKDFIRATQAVTDLSNRIHDISVVEKLCEFLESLSSLLETQEDKDFIDLHYKKSLANLAILQDKFEDLIKTSINILDNFRSDDSELVKAIVDKADLYEKKENATCQVKCNTFFNTSSY